MKLKKITLHYREMNQWFKDYDNREVEENEKPLVIFKTKEGGLGVRRHSHDWEVGESIWTADGKELSTIVAIAPHSKLEPILDIFKNATYIVNRFESERERQNFLYGMERVLVELAN